MNNNENLQYFIYSKIKEKIINCEIRPGEYIDEKEFLAQVGSSKTPFREAIIRLKSEGLVEVRPRHGFYATNLSPRSVSEVFILRKILEPEIAIRNFDKIDISKLIEINEKLRVLAQSKETVSPNDYADLDFEFHKYFTEVADNKKLEEIMYPLLEQARRITMFNHWRNKPSKPWENAIKQHDEIINALMKEDRTAIMESFNIHFNYFLAKSYQHLKEN